MFLKAIFAICRKWISGSLCLSGHVRIRKPVIASALLIILSFGLVHAQDSGAAASISVTDDKYSCSIRKESFASVINGAPGAAGSILNHMDAAAVRRYLDHMVDTIEARIGPLSGHVRAFFVDSMELEGNNWT